MSINPALKEAVKRLQDLEEQYRLAKIEVADLFLVASNTQSITTLSLFTGVNRTTIYWLMRVWSTNANKNRSNRSQEGEALS